MRPGVILESNLTDWMVLPNKLLPAMLRAIFPGYEFFLVGSSKDHGITLLLNFKLVVRVRRTGFVQSGKRDLTFRFPFCEQPGFGPCEKLRAMGQELINQIDFLSSIDISGISTARSRSAVRCLRIFNDCSAFAARSQRGVFYR